MIDTSTPNVKHHYVFTKIFQWHADVKIKYIQFTLDLKQLEEQKKIYKCNTGIQL